MTFLQRPRTLLRRLTIATGLCLIGSVAQAQDVHYLAKELAFDGIVPEQIASKIQPELLEKLEIDAEAAYFKSATVGAERSIIISLSKDAPRRARLLAEKSGEGLASLQQEVRASQDRVLRAVATKDRQGFRLRNRYTTLAGFSAYADFHAIAALALQDDVVFVEEMQVFESQALLDTRADDLTEVSPVHSLGSQGNGVTIAVIDTGIDYTQPYFFGFPNSTLPTQKVIGGYDFGDDDADPKIDCADDSHGTATAFIAGGIGGVAPQASLVHLKVQSAAKCGGLSMDGDIPGAIDWVVTNQATHGIDIISMSLGTNSTYSSSCSAASSSQYRDALDAADILVFAASGNDGDKNGMSFPACYSSVYSVGAVYDRKYKNSTWKFYNDDGSIMCKDKKPKAGEVTCYSNSASFLDFLGPSNCAKVASPNFGTDGCFSGTSAATPFVAGVAALIMNRNPSLTGDEIATHMKIFGTGKTDPDNNVSSRLVHAFRTWAFTPAGN